jgi:hypothetical protein
MRNTTLCLLAVMLGSVAQGFGQEAATHPSNTNLPRVVATFKRWNQDHEISPRTIFTPKGFGVYRISIVVVVTAGSPEDGPYWLFNLNWSDGSQRGQYSLQPVSSHETQWYGVDFPMRDLPRKPITFNVERNGDTKGSKYNVFVVVEQIM